jgi:hypothetical protein
MGLFQEVIMKPQKGELFKLVDALKPTTLTLEVCKAHGWAYPPVLLTYKGAVTGSVVRSVFNL